MGYLEGRVPWWRVSDGRHLEKGMWTVDADDLFQVAYGRYEEVG